MWEEVWTEERRERKVRKKYIPSESFFVPVFARSEKFREYIIKRGGNRMRQKRISDYGYRIGHHENGPRNKITDVPGVRVGHATVEKWKSAYRSDGDCAGRGQSVSEKVAGVCLRA